MWFSYNHSTNIQKFVSFYSLSYQLFLLFLLNSEWTFSDSFDVCANSVALFLPFHLYLVIFAILLFCGNQIDGSNLLDAIFNIIHHHHYYYYYTIEIQLSWNDPIFLSFSFIFWPYCFSPPSLFFYLPYLLPRRRSCLYIFSTLNQLKMRNNKTVRNHYWWRRLWWRISMYIFYDVFNESHLERILHTTKRESKHNIFKSHVISQYEAFNTILTCIHKIVNNEESR